MHGSMSFYEVTSLILERLDALNNYWSLYIGVLTVIGATLALGAAQLRARTLRLAVCLGFVGFAAVNIGAILQQLAIRRDLIQFLEAHYAKSIDVIENAYPHPTWVYVLVHGLFDLLVVVSIWKVGSSARAQEARS